MQKEKLGRSIKTTIRLMGGLAAIGAAILIAISWPESSPPEMTVAGDDSRSTPASAAVAIIDTVNRASGQGRGAHGVDGRPGGYRATDEVPVDAESLSGYASNVHPAPASTNSRVASVTPSRHAGNSDSPQSAQSDDPVRTRRADPDEADRTDDFLDNRATHSISGRVLDDQGRPLGGIEIIAAASRLFGNWPSDVAPTAQMRHRARSDPGGRYRFDALPDGEYRIQTVPTSRYPSSQIAVRAGVDFADLVLVGQRQVRISGSVTSVAMGPVEGVLVVPTIPGERGSYSRADGTFELAVTMKQSARGFAVRAQHVDYREQQLTFRDRDFETDTMFLDIVLEPIAALTVVTGSLTGSDGVPATGRFLQLRSSLTRQIYTSSTDTDGRFTLVGVETSDDYTLVIPGDERYGDFQMAAISVPAEGLALDLILEPAATGGIYGVMQTPDGAPLANFTLTLRRDAPPYHSRRVTSDGTGSFVVRGLPAGRIVLESRSYPRLVVSGVDVEVGRERQVPLILDVGTNRILGSVTDRDGIPVHVPTVLLNWSQSGDGWRSQSNRKTVADVQGSFEFSQLGPGPHTVVINAPGFRPVSVEHDVVSQGFHLAVQLEPELPALGMVAED